MTVTVTVHELLAGIVPPVNVSVPGLVAFADAVTVPVVQLVAAFDTTALRRFKGYVSRNAAPVIAVVLGFVRVIVSVDVSLTATLTGKKDLATVGGSSTVSVELAAARLLPLLVVSPPAGMVFT